MAKIDIVKQEMVRLEQKREQRNYNVCIILLVINFLAGIYIYSKFGKKHNPTHKFTYYRDIPNNYHPTITEYLLKRKITNKSISAAILNLIEKEYITYEKISDDNYKLFDNSKDKEDIDKLDKQLLEIIFLKKDEITLKQLNNRNNKNSNSYYKKCRKYLDDSRELAKKEGFYDKDVEEEKEKKNKKKTNSFKTIFEIIIIILAVIFPPIILLTIFIGIFISLIGKDKKKNLVVIIGYISETILLFIIIDTIISNHFVKTSIGYMLLAMLLIIILFIYVKTVDRRTQKGEDEYNKCKAFNKFLKDFGNFDDKDLIEISLWEKYLVFATLFGCSSKLLKSMKLKLVDVEDSEELADLINITTSNAFSSSLSSSIGKSISTTYYSSGGSDSGSGSNYSSGSGGGGGFSSGGGSFGGGSGGGRF